MLETTAATREAFAQSNKRSLPERARWLHAALDNPEPIIAPIVARLCKICGRFRDVAPALTQPAAAALFAASPFARAAADTS